MKRFLQVLILILSGFIFSQNISGNVISEDEVLIPKVLIVNMTTNQKTYSDAYGKFVVNANIGDEIRFAKESYKLGKIVITSNNFQVVKLEKIPQEIEEVKIINKNLAESQEEKLRKDIGLPKGPEKPREKPVEAKEVLLPLVFAQLNIDNLYKWLSGNSRRLKNRYKYEDLQEGLAWIQNNVDLEYFAEAGISPDKFNDFLMFSLKDEKVLMYMKAKNVGGITVALDNNISAYLERITKK
ncbi:hypothetical protein ACFOWU_00640 [Epilithonimonas zeae]|uniref:Carboxypeptidase regulatory-like domain-containing protein n=1 Tax=Epilithonimonas zeae TaxID=1416779 RepID=A0A1N6DXT8_9FLAO|nr:hypothetical protein [Epilithonimonas zeae]SIN75524.1 hypothetical protein SAMN05444409_0132 [Epilithonimonas zeae]